MADDLLAQRRAKLYRLREQGIDPFPHAFEGVEPIADVREQHAGLEAGAETEARHRLAGRLHARRGQGGMAFLDLGDIVGVDGVVFMSRRGELTIRVEDFTVLAKSLRPPPDKHHGLADVETRYRRRELDLIANENTRATFIVRARVVAAVRRYLDDEGFLEVETPILQPLYGGALARPFVTHHNE